MKMKCISKFWFVLFVLTVSSCSTDSVLEDHMLIGNYLGNWNTVPEIESKFSIEYEGKEDKLVFFFSLADSLDLNVLSETEFSIDPYEQNGYSNNLSGKLIQDTLYLQNEVFLIGDNQNNGNVRTGVFVRQ